MPRGGVLIWQRGGGTMSPEIAGKRQAMTGPDRRGRNVTVSVEAMDHLMPMHVHISAEGRITTYGPTLGKISAGRNLVGLPFFDVFEIRRPAVSNMAELFERQGKRLTVAMVGVEGAGFRGLVMPDAGNGMILNLSFGIGVADAVRALSLTNSDFAPTDMAVELLWLAEAKRAVLEELRRLNARLEDEKSEAQELALSDPMTGLRNRRGLDRVLLRACSGEVPFAVMLLDLDYFKAVNDSLGHAAGDHVLRAVAQILLQETRISDTVARVGGDEFVILLPGQTDVEVLTRAAQRIIASLQAPILFEGKPCEIGVSVGISLSTDYAIPEADRMLGDADQALYAAKRAGRARVEMYSKVA
jgi:diguanylate cyclase (GGDEF)-like protein